MANDTSTLNDCGCCEGVSAQTPAAIDNRPGLSAVAYRIGTHPSFKQSLLAGLAGGPAPLRDLTTRDDDDFTIALLDAWAAVGDVLTFYQERIANENYLRTATERLSLFELARLIGYRPKPGIAATALLAFTVDGNVGSPQPAKIPIGTKVQSVPGVDETPQTFETIEEIDARAEWNALRLRMTEPQVLAFGSIFAWFGGTGLNLNQGDILLFVDQDREQNPSSDRWDWRRVAQVTVDAANNQTRLDWAQPLGSVNPPGEPARVPRVYALRKRASIFGYNAPEWRALLDSQKRTYLGLPDGAVLTDEQKAEWPNFVITTPGTSVISNSLFIPPTPRNIAQAVINAVNARVDEFRRSTVGGVARSAVAAVQTMDSATAAVSTLSEGVHKAADLAATKVADRVRGLIDNPQPGSIINAIKNALDGNMAADVASVASQAASDVLQLNDLANKVGELVDATTSTAGDAAQIAGLLAAMLQVNETIKAAADDPAATIDSVETTVKAAAELAPVTAQVAAVTAYGYVAALPDVGDALIKGGEMIKQVALDTLEKAKAGINLPISFPVFAGEEGTIDLEATYPAVLSDSWVLLSIPATQELYRVKSAIEAARAQFMLSGKTTRLTLEGENLKAMFETQVRATSVFAQSELLPLLTERPLEPQAVTGLTSTLTVVGQITELLKGRRLIVAGQLADGSGVAAEEVTVDSCAQAGSYTQVELARGLANSYVLTSVTVHANATLATHGETVSEVLGSGDGAREYQAFTLKQKPVTHLSDAQTEGGAASTLVLRVNDVLWDEASTLYARGAKERIYNTRFNDDESTTVQFGDGVNGARLPTGAMNLRAVYRKGAGAAGNVKAGQLSTLMTRPLGVTGAINPLPAAGGEDAEQRDDARDNAPLTVLTLDRVVSLLDYENFARAFAGVKKALATWSWVGEQRAVFLTIAGANGTAIAENSDIYINLFDALRAKGDPFVPLRMKTYRNMPFAVVIKVKADPAYVAQDVRDAVKQALIDAFSFAQRSFGQPVHASEIIAVAQRVAGVVACDVDGLVREDWQGGFGLKQPLPAAMPSLDANGEMVAAELLTLKPEYVFVSEMV